MENGFLAKGSSGSNVILEEIQDTLHNIISDTDQINPPLDASADEHLEEPNPQVVVEEVLVPSSDTSTQVEIELNPHTVADQVQTARRTSATEVSKDSPFTQEVHGTARGLSV